MAVSRLENNSYSDYPYNKIKSIMSQMIAVFVGNVIMLQCGLSMGMSTVINGQLLSNESRFSDGFSLSHSEASWYGSLLLVFHPVGSILSAHIQDKYGRKTCFVLVCFPQFIGWTLLSLADSSKMLYLSSISLGIAMGISEAPVLTYVGECVESKNRSVFSSLSNFSSMIGLFLLYVLASVIPWRHLVSSFLILPIIVFIMVTFIIPESPVWLLSKNEVKKAKLNLRWLRGFTDDESVQEELLNLLQFVKGENHDAQPIISSNEQLSLIEKINNVWKMINEDNVRRPFILLNVVFFFCVINSMIPVKPYLLNVIGIIGLPIEGKLALVIIGTFTIFGSFLNMLIVKLIPKRRLLLVCMSTSTVCQLCIGLYSTEFVKSIVNNSWIPYSLFCTVSFISGFGILPIPWILLGEIFPMKGRGTVSGITTAINFITGFLLIKTYFNVVSLLTLPGTTLIYCFISALGIPYMYYKFPNTDNKTLQQIQQCFSE